jgi:hypothetical protein
MSTQSETPDETDSEWHTSCEDLEKIAEKYPDDVVGQLAQVFLESRRETKS